MSTVAYYITLELRLRRYVRPIGHAYRTRPRLILIPPYFKHYECN